MFCPKCGTNVPEGSKFCESCGNNMQQSEQSVHQVSPQESPKPTYNPNPAPAYQPQPRPQPAPAYQNNTVNIVDPRDRWLVWLDFLIFNSDRWFYSIVSLGFWKQHKQKQKELGYCDAYILGNCDSARYCSLCFSYGCARRFYRSAG